jgi:predicted AAA+ superfamily ATPase
LQVAYAAARSWVLATEALFHGFFIRPWSKSVKRSLTSEPKYYLFDLLQISATNPGARRENLAAIHLHKLCQYLTDTAVGDFSLHFHEMIKPAYTVQLIESPPDYHREYRITA